MNPSSEPATSNADEGGRPLYIANAVKQPLASHCALVGLVARKHVETHQPKRADWALGALLAGFLHDIGKLKIPDQILLKPGPLDTEQWRVMRHHAEYGREFLDGIEFLHAAADLVYSHHEKFGRQRLPARPQSRQYSRWRALLCYRRCH